MAKYSKECVLCGKMHEYCNTCAAYQNKPVWLFSYCSEDCKNIVGILTDYIFNKISKKEAEEKLKDKDTSRYMHYKGSYKKAFEDITSDGNDVIIEETKSIIDDVKTSIAQDTAAAVKKNTMSETNKVYPKAIAHKHGK